MLVYWLLFLFSWQCGFSVTASALEMLLKFLSRFFWVLETFHENSCMALAAKCFPNSLYKLRKHLVLLNKDDFVPSVSLCMTTKTASRVAVVGKSQLSVSLWHGQNTPTGENEVCLSKVY